MAAVPAVLLCGGLGLRQRADGDDLPKSVRPLADGRPLLLHVLDHYLAYGVREFVICVGYGADHVRDVVSASEARLPAQIAFVDDGPAAGKCERLLHARDEVGDRAFLFGYGDVLSDLDLDALVRRHRAQRRLLTLTATRAPSRYGVVTLGADREVQAFAEKPVEPALISAGYFACEPGLFDELSPRLSLERDVIPRLVASGSVAAHLHEGFWLGVDTYKDFLDAEALMTRKGLPWSVAV